MSTDIKYMSFTLKKLPDISEFPKTIFLAFDYMSDGSITHWYNVNENLTRGGEINISNISNIGSFDGVDKNFTILPVFTDGIKTYPSNNNSSDPYVIPTNFYDITFDKTSSTSPTSNITINTQGVYAEYEGVYTFTETLESLDKVVDFAFIENKPDGFPDNIILGFKYEINSGAILNWYNMVNTCINLDSKIKYKWPYMGIYTAKTKEFTAILFLPNDNNTIQLYAKTTEDVLNDFNVIVYKDVEYDCSVNFISNCCFSEGTKILSLTNFKNGIYEEDLEKSLEKSLEVSLTSQIKEEYILVQDLKIGDLVKTYLHGYRRISRVLKGNFKNNPKEKGVANCMYRMLKTKDNELIEDLTLTRNHGVLVEKLSENEEKNVDKKNLEVVDGLLSIITADSDKFEKVEDTNVYNYYHFSLDGDGDNDRRFGIYANGLLVETPSNNMMDNALYIKPLDF
jgi:hypothetical protein